MKLKINRLITVPLLVLFAVDCYYYLSNHSILTSTEISNQIQRYIRQNPSILLSLETPTLDNRYRLYESLTGLQHQLQQQFSLKTIYLIITEADKQICWNQAIPDTIYRNLLKSKPVYPDSAQRYYGSIPLSDQANLIFLGLPAQHPETSTSMMVYLNALVILLVLLHFSKSYPRLILIILSGLVVVNYFLPYQALVGNSPVFSYHRMLFFYPQGISFHAFGLAITLAFIGLINLIITRELRVSPRPTPTKFLLNTIGLSLYSIGLNVFIFYGMTGLVLENEHYFLSMRSFFPSEMTVFSYLLLVLLILTWLAGMEGLRKTYPISFRIGMILWIALFIYSAQLILLIILIWSILFLYRHVPRYKHLWLWIILVGNLIIIVAITLHQWNSSAQMIEYQSRFLLRYDRYKYEQTIHKLDQMEPGQISRLRNYPLPFLYYSIHQNLEYCHRLPYPFYHFWLINKNRLIEQDSLLQGVFYYENQTFYFMAQATKQGNFFLLPNLEKNYQYWLDRRAVYQISLDELRPIEALNYNFFKLTYGEYQNNQLIKSLYPGAQIFPARAPDLKLQKKITQMMIPVQDINLNGHWLAISYSWPDRYRLLDVWIKNYLLLTILFLLVFSLIRQTRSPLSIRQIIEKYNFSSFLTKLIAVQSISLLLLMISLFYLTRDSLKKYSLRQLEESFIQHQLNIEDYFLQRIDQIDRYLARLLVQWETRRTITADESDQLSILYYLFDQDGRLVYQNYPADWLDDTRLTALERTIQPGYSLDIVHNQLFMIFTTPYQLQNQFAGKALLAVPVTQSELNYLFEIKGIAYTFYLKDRNILAEDGLFFNQLFPTLIDFQDYYDLLNNQAPSILNYENKDVTFTARSRLFSEDKLGLVSFIRTFESPVLQAINNQYFISFILLTALAIFLIVLINRQMTRHISQVADFIPSILENKQARRLPVMGHDEFSLLTRAINHLSENLQREKEKTLQLEKERLVNELAREIAHEIKNPLTPMQLSLQHLNDVYHDDREEFISIYPPIAQRLQNQIEILNQLSHKFLAISKFEIGPLHPIDPVPILIELTALYNQNQPLFRIMLHESHIPVSILANQQSLNQLFVNLIKNALEASESETDPIEIILQPKKSTLTITFRDSGIGIPEDIRHRIFLPYYTTKISGSGLGLTICKKIMDHLQGEISLQSNLPRGTIVNLRFPIHRPDNPEIPDHLNEPDDQVEKTKPT